VLRACEERQVDPVATKVFISYAKEDHGFACDLYSALRQSGFTPWMDKPPPPHDLDGLQPGQRWRDELEKQIRSADLVILILSEMSIQKVGYVQREFRLTLHLMNEMPPNRRFAVPVLKEACEVPDLIVGDVRLRDLQWTPIYETGLDRFVDALKHYEQ
jgi:TIR domain